MTTSKPNSRGIRRVAAVVVLAVLAPACQFLDQDLDSDGEFDDLGYTWLAAEAPAMSLVTVEACNGEIDVSYSETQVTIAEVRPPDGPPGPDYEITSPRATKAEVRFEDGGRRHCLFIADVRGEYLITGFTDWDWAEPIDSGAEVHEITGGVPALTVECLSGSGAKLALPIAPESDNRLLAINPAITTNGTELYKYAIFDYKTKLAEAGCGERGPALNIEREGRTRVETYQTVSTIRFMDGDTVLPAFSDAESACMRARADITADLYERTLECDTDKDNNVNGVMVELGQEVVRNPIPEPVDTDTALLQRLGDGLALDVLFWREDIQLFEHRRQKCLFMAIPLTNTVTGEVDGVAMTCYADSGPLVWYVGKASQASIDRLLETWALGFIDIRKTLDSRVDDGEYVRFESPVDIIARGKGFIAGYEDSVWIDGASRSRDLTAQATVEAKDDDNNGLVFDRFEMAVGTGSIDGQGKPVIGEKFDLVRSWVDGVLTDDIRRNILFTVETRAVPGVGAGFSATFRPTYEAGVVNGMDTLLANTDASVEIGARFSIKAVIGIDLGVSGGKGITFITDPQTGALSTEQRVFAEAAFDSIIKAGVAFTTDVDTGTVTLAFDFGVLGFDWQVGWVAPEGDLGEIGGPATLGFAYNVPFTSFSFDILGYRNDTDPANDLNLFPTLPTSDPIDAFLSDYTIPAMPGR